MKKVLDLQELRERSHRTSYVLAACQNTAHTIKSGKPLNAVTPEADLYAETNPSDMDELNDSYKRLFIPLIQREISTTLDLFNMLTIQQRLIGFAIIKTAGDSADPEAELEPEDKAMIETLSKELDGNENFQNQIKLKMQMLESIFEQAGIDFPDEGETTLYARQILSKITPDLSDVDFETIRNEVHVRTMESITKLLEDIAEKANLEIGFLQRQSWFENISPEERKIQTDKLKRILTEGTMMAAIAGHHIGVLENFYSRQNKARNNKDSDGFRHG